MWVCTSTGSSAAMHGAGGHLMDTSSTDVQYMIREHLLEVNGDPKIKALGHGLIGTKYCYDCDV